MTEQEMKLIQRYFQLHSLIADGQGDSEQANGVRGDMEMLEQDLDEQTTTFMGNISCYCYALAERDSDLKRRYVELLFANTIDMDKLNVIFELSGLRGKPPGISS